MDQFRPPGAAMPFPPPRRHSTAPISFQPPPPQTAPKPVTGGSVETLYNHPSVKIVAFTAGKSAFDRLGSGHDDKPGTLPSSSQFERTIAIGGFQIYRAPGSVAFLRSGSALQPILPKSQCWCLDEQSSKFVLQIRRPNYWRIEVPVSNDEEIRRALVLREVLDKVLQFEKTPCPFERNFTVELPETPKTPVKKKPWVPTPPARSVSMNWPPGQPATPPPEFPTRTRFYNPSARRFSDFGIDMSNMSLAPSKLPRKSEKEAEKEMEKEVEKEKEAEVEERDSPSRRQGEAAMMILEEPEPLSPPLTAIPSTISEMIGEPAVQAHTATIPQEGDKSTHESVPSTSTETKTTQVPIRPREPIWVTKRVPSSAVRRAKKSTTIHTQSPDPVPSHQTKPTLKKPELEESPHLEKAVLPNDSTQESESEQGALEGSGQLRMKRSRVAAFASRRAATAPALSLRTLSTSTVDSASSRIPEETAEADIPQPGSPAESLDSFHSVESHQSWHSPISPPLDSPACSPTKTYPYPHENIPLAPNLRNGQMSDFTTTPTVSGWDRNSVGAVVGSGALTPNTPFTEAQDEEPGSAVEGKSNLEPLKEDIEDRPTAIPICALNEDIQTSATDTDSLSSSWSSAASQSSSRSNTRMRHRAATTSMAISHTAPRALSPLPPAANILNTDLTGRASTAARAIRRIPSSIFNRTCEILITPPAHLISIMLKVAARITAGEWRGFVFGMDEGGEVVDIRWDWTDDGELEGAMLEGWAESDFDFSDIRTNGLRNRTSARKSRASFAAAEASRPRGRAEYQDPWATPPEEPDLDEGEHWSRNWGVD